MYLLMRKKPQDKQKKLCVVRYGAWGDAIMLSPVFKYYKQQGYHVTLNCTNKCYDILKTNPHIDAYLLQEHGSVEFQDLPGYWKKLEKQFDKFINFSGSIEGNLLVSPKQDEYLWDKEKLHKKCNKNYYDETMKWGGLAKHTGEVGELYFTKSEERWAKKFRKKHKGFLVVWCLTGSAIHKIYPHADAVIQAIARGIKESQIILVGEKGATGIIDVHRRVFDYCGAFGIRESLVLAKYADLVVTPETSMLAGAGCFGTPTVALLSQGSEENITKYYKNCVVVRQDVPCSPCHKMHYCKDTCPLDKEFGLPICMSLLSPTKLLDPIEKIYMKWRERHGNPNTAN